MTHIAVIPARKGSVGLPGKNRMFFDATADFVASVPWFDRVVVSTDDEVVAAKARERRFEVRERPADLAGPAVSIKAVFADLIPAMGLGADDRLWLFYLPILYKNRPDFDAAKRIADAAGFDSLVSFVPAQTHPFNCWAYDGKSLRQYVANDAFRRQDLPPAWMHYHYLACFRAGAVPRLNSELIDANTHPIFLDAETTANLIEVDTPEDFARWKAHQAEAARP